MSTAEDGTRAPLISLHQAARNGDLENVSRLLADEKVRADIDDLDENGMSALHYAARFNHHNVVRMLIEDGKANAQVKDEEKAIPLHYACRKKQITQNTPREFTNAAVKTINILSEYCDVNARDSYGSTPLHFSAMRGNLVACKTLLKKENILINAQDNMACTPLHLAATYNQRDVAATLIKKGIRILHADKSKCTALHQACIEGSAEVVALLLEKVEDKFKQSLVDAVDDDYNKALHYAIEARSLPCVRLLMEHGANVNDRCRLSSVASTPLHLAAIEDEPDIIKLLLENGAKINAQDLRMATPLHRAAEYECKNAIKQLLANVDCALELRDDQNYSPLLCASCYSEPECVSYLLEENADIKVTEDQERSCIFLAATYEQEEVLKTLIEHISGSENAYILNQVDRYGNTPLHVVSALGNLALVKLLLNNGADMVTKNEDEETAFLMACEHGRLKVVEALLEEDDRCQNDEDEYSNTGLHLAAREGHFSVVQMLVSSGADKDCRNNRLFTPLDLAAMKGHVKIVEYLVDEEVPVNPADKDKEPPLHLAARNGHDRVVSLLIQRGADVGHLHYQDGIRREGYNCLEVAIERGNRSVAAAILQSDKWHEALNNDSIQQRKYDEPRITPLRKLIHTMPEIVPIALSKMIRRLPEGVSNLHPDLNIEFNLDYLDDTYTKYGPKALMPNESINEESNSPARYEKPYTSDLNWVKKNHPLTRMIEDKQEALLSHPAVLAVIRHKWARTQKFYFLFLFYYALFVGLVTAYMLNATSEKFEKLDLAEDGIDPDTFNCTSADDYQNDFNDAAKYLIWILAVFGIIIEGFQFAATRSLYFDLINLLDWFTYISACAIVVDISECGLRKDWQWELGAFAVLFSWLDLLMFLRRLPDLGIYIVMITEIFWTFAKFFTVFLLFIVAFSLSNYILLQNQEPFSTPFYAIVKTWVMFLGEFDFNDIFHGEEPEEEIQYEAATYALFIIFLMIMAIIIMNLLVGLAVDDVYALREQAKMVKLKMQIDLAIEVELALPESWKRRLTTNVRRIWLEPNKPQGTFDRMSTAIQTMIEGPLLTTQTIFNSVKNLDLDVTPDLEGVEHKLEDKINSNQEQLMKLHDRLDNIETLLKNMK